MTLHTHILASPAASPQTASQASETASRRPQAWLALEDGSVFHGTAFGDTAPRVVDAEVCFNTSLTGYQEILTDPSYAGQIVTMTYPLIGNYGINLDDLESARVQVTGFVVRELAHISSNFRATHKLEQWLAEAGVMGIQGIDTRALTRKLRIDGAMNGVLSTDPTKTCEKLVELARRSQGVIGRNLAKGVSCREPRQWDQGVGHWQPLQGEILPSQDRQAGAKPGAEPGARYRVVAIDCGAKLNILRNLVDIGCDVTVLPWDADARQVLDMKPDGLFISNGPGDPAAVQATVAMLREVAGKLPIFGICLGHQLLGLSLGARTFKLKFGHRGGNQPVQNLHTRKVEITSQNHGFAVERESLEQAGGEPTHINLNDKTLEGFRHRDMPIFAVQYHPEASPGPHDARYLFDCFAQMMATGQSPTGEQMDLAQRQRNNVQAASIGV